LKDALVRIERTDVRGNYKVKTNKKGEYLHAGLPLGEYRVMLEVNGKVVDTMQGVRTRLGENTTVEFNLFELRKKQESLQAAAASGTLTDEQARGMSAEQKAAMEKAMKEREAAMRKNKELNEAFSGGMAALKTGDYDTAITSLTRASEIDAKQHVVWVQLADAYIASSAKKAGPEAQQTLEKGLEAYAKGIELKPDDAAYYNNYGLALAKARRIEEAEKALTRAAELDPPSAGKYFYNLGAVLTNTGQLEPAGQAFKRAFEADPNYADAHYQYGVYLMSKAQVTEDGKVVPLPGTREAFEKYLELKPSGPFADSAKGMIASIETAVETQYVNPDAAKAKKTKKK
jgi:tetratricopeptide (TPR) repeat protein